MATILNPRETLVRVAFEWVGIRETSKNHFPGMEKVWGATSYPMGFWDRQPYCAAFVCWVVAEAVKRNPVLSVPVLPTMAAVVHWKEWARNPKAGVTTFRPNEYTPAPGDIGSLLPKTSHIVIVDSYDAANQIVHTLEGNTDDDGGREGDGFYSKARKLASFGEFYRIAARGVKA